jgi:hypothetical protein
LANLRRCFGFLTIPRNLLPRIKEAATELASEQNFLEETDQFVTVDEIKNYHKEILG